MRTLAKSADGHKLIEMSQAEADRTISELDAHIGMNQASEVKIKTSEDMITDTIRVVFYDCTNKNGQYVKYEIYKDGNLINEEISFSKITLCKRLNRWMSANKL